MSVKFSVIIPLYNKEAEIERTLRSVLAQSVLPHEIVVVDDGSTDRSAAIVESIGSPLIKLIRQANGGECAARNTAMSNAEGTHYALVDADDAWKPNFLEEMKALIEEFPECGLYCSAFDIINTDGRHPSNSPTVRGVVGNFFEESMTRYVAIPSASVIPAEVVARVGGFPEGMKLGGDQFMWVKIAREYSVAYTPLRLTDYYMAASNRSSAIYKAESTPHSFMAFYDPANEPLNEYIARVEMGKAIVISAKGGTKDAAERLQFYAYNRRSRKLWWRLRIMNALPMPLRAWFHSAYTWLAWKIARRGL